MSPATVTATNHETGEVVELPAETPQQIVAAWQQAAEYAKLAERLKDQLKKLVPTLVDERGQSEPIGDHQFRVMTVQRQTYDKATMRRVLDEDIIDLLLKPDKTAIDGYLKENLENLGPDVAHELRATMQPDGDAYEVIKLERIKRGGDGA